MSCLCELYPDITWTQGWYLPGKSNHCDVIVLLSCTGRSLIECFSIFYLPQNHGPWSISRPWTISSACKPFQIRQGIQSTLKITPFPFHSIVLTWGRLFLPEEPIWNAEDFQTLVNIWPEVCLWYCMFRFEDDDITDSISTIYRKHRWCTFSGDQRSRARVHNKLIINNFFSV